MKTPTILSLILTVIIILTSCGDTKENSNVLIGDNSDTIQVTKQFPRTGFKVVTIYRNNRPFEYIALTNSNDTLKMPSLKVDKSRQFVFAFLPIIKNRKAQELLIESDSTLEGKAFRNLPFENQIAFEFPLTRDLRTKDTIQGVVKYYNDSTKAYYYYPVEFGTK
jgi:hypothetical protein